jgi:hypothetical protein
MFYNVLCITISISSRLCVVSIPRLGDRNSKYCVMSPKRGPSETTSQSYFLTFSVYPSTIFVLFIFVCQP